MFGGGKCGREYGYERGALTNEIHALLKKDVEASPAVQWLRLCFRGRGIAWIPAQGTKTLHAPQWSQNIKERET